MEAPRQPSVASSNISANFNISVISDDLFKAGTDDIIFEGELMKFKPGLSANFISRYIQISKRAFRYFKSRLDAQTGRKPLVNFRNNII